LLPEHYEQLHGVLELGKGNVEQFVEELRSAITTDMKTIRQTDVDVAGSFKTADVQFSGGSSIIRKDLFVDRIGRVVVPAGEGPTGESWGDVATVEFVGEGPQEVLSCEPRYEDEKQVSWVLYLTPTLTEEESVLD